MSMTKSGSVDRMEKTTLRSMCSCFAGLEEVYARGRAKGKVQRQGGASGSVCVPGVKVVGVGTHSRTAWPATCAMGIGCSGYTGSDQVSRRRFSTSILSQSLAKAI